MSAPAPIMIMAGGTGGHVFPALAVAEQILARGIPVVWMGSRNGLEAKLVPPTGIEVEWIGVAGLRGNGYRRLLGAPWMLTKAMWQSAAAIRKRRPQLVLGMGGFTAGPGGVMAKVLGLPLVIHEQNAVAGLTNRLLSRIASRVLEAFPGSFSSERKAIETGNPVRKSIAEIESPDIRLSGRGVKGRLLVLGGSQGALALNQIAPRAIALMGESMRPDVRHQAGGRLLESAQAAYQEAKINVQPTAFIEDMAQAYAWADLVLCRSGALTVAELAAAGVASILVPYPHAVDDHQTANARFLSDSGAAVLLPQKHLNERDLAELLSDLLSDRSRIQSMADKARSLARPNAASRVADLALELVKEQPA